MRLEHLLSGAEDSDKSESNPRPEADRIAGNKKDLDLKTKEQTEFAAFTRKGRACVLLRKLQ